MSALLLADQPQGGRHATLVRIAGYLREQVPQDVALSVALLWNAERCRPPLPTAEVIADVRDLYRRYPAPPTLLLRRPGTETLPAVPPIPEVPAVCRRGWIGEYLRTMAPTTEAPDAYHLGGALAAASTVLGRSCFTRYGRRVYPNVYVLLVGSSGKTRKDTAIQRALDAMAPPDLVPPTWRTLDTVASAEGLVERLGGGKSLLLVLSEMSILLRNARREGTNNIIPYLTKLFDCPDLVEVPSRKNPVMAYGPFLSLFGATTPEWFSEDTTSDDIRGGFLGRFLYFTGEPKASIDDPPAPEHAALYRLRLHLHQVARAFAADAGTEGVEIALSTDAVDWWRTFYRDEAGHDYAGDFEVLSQRVPLYVRKVGLLFAALAGRVEITSEDLEAAAALVRLSQDYVRIAHGDWGASPDSKLQMKMLTVVHENGCAMHKSRLHQRLSGRYKGPVFSDAIRSLVAFERLSIESGTLRCRHAERRNGTVADAE